MSDKWTSGLSNRKAGDWVWLEIRRFSDRPAERELRKVQHVDRKGRLYISAESLWGKWRYGFKPDTGTAQEYRYYTMVDATPEEIASELHAPAIRDDEKKREESVRNLQYRQQQAAPRMVAVLQRELVALDHWLQDQSISEETLGEILLREDEIQKLLKDLEG